MLDEDEFSHESLLTTRKKTKLTNACEKNMRADTKLPTTQISKISQNDGFLDALLSKITGQLMKVAVSLAKNISAPLELTTEASEIDAGIRQKIHDSGMITLIISKEEINHIIKIIQAL